MKTFPYTKIDSKALRFKQFKFRDTSRMLQKLLIIQVSHTKTPIV